MRACSPPSKVALPRAMVSGRQESSGKFLNVGPHWMPPSPQYRRRLWVQVLTGSHTCVVACCRLLMRGNSFSDATEFSPILQCGLRPLWGFCSLTAHPCLGLESFLKPQRPRSSDSLRFYLRWSLRRARRWVPVSSNSPDKERQFNSHTHQSVNIRTSGRPGRSLQCRNKEQGWVPYTVGE